MLKYIIITLLLPIFGCSSEEPKKLAYYTIYTNGDITVQIKCSDKTHSDYMLMLNNCVTIPLGIRVEAVLNATNVVEVEDK